MNTTETKRERMFKNIQQHGENLNKIFNTGLEPYKLCSKLNSLEKRAHKLTTDYCNGENGINSYEVFERKCLPIMAAVRKALFPKGMTNTPLDWCIFINGDARGYALKISDKYVRENNIDIHKDWGGYGIIAPDFSPSND